MSDYYDYLKELSRHYSYQLVSNLIVWTSMNLIVVSGMVFSANRYNTLAGYFLLGFFLINLTMLVRSTYWLYRMLRHFWIKFRPPYSYEKLVFSYPNRDKKYSHRPTNSLVRFPIGVLLTVMFIWAAVHKFYQSFEGIIVGGLVWVINLVPEQTIGFGLTLFSLYLGIPPESQSQITGDQIRIVFTIIFWLPSLFMAVLTTWNMLYQIDMYLSQEEDKTSLLLRGELISKSDARIFPMALISMLRGFKSGSREALRKTWIVLTLSSVLLIISTLVFRYL